MQGGPAGLSGALRDVADFPDEPAALGLIPKALREALQELGVDSTLCPGLADDLASLSQCAIASELYARAKDIAETRDARALYSKHVNGKPSRLRVIPL
jgi:hypothetical protein